MKRFLIVLAVLVLSVGAVSASKPDKLPKEDKKVTICHATSSASNPWVRVVVSENATAGHFENNGTTKAGHEGDVLLQGDVPCPVVPPVDDDKCDPSRKDGECYKDPDANTPATPQPVVEAEPSVEVDVPSALK